MSVSGCCASRSQDPRARWNQQNEAAGESSVCTALLLPSIPPTSSAFRCRLVLSPHVFYYSHYKVTPYSRCSQVLCSGATSRFLQLFSKTWPFHLLYSHRTSLSSHNLTISRDPELSGSLSSVTSPSRRPLFSKINISYAKPLIFLRPSDCFNFNLVKVSFNPTMHTRIQFVWKTQYKIKFYCIIR